MKLLRDGGCRPGLGVGGDCDGGLSARTNGGLGNGRGGKSESGDGQGEGGEA